MQLIYPRENDHLTGPATDRQRLRDRPEIILARHFGRRDLNFTPCSIKTGMSPNREPIHVPSVFPWLSFGVPLVSFWCPFKPIYVSWVCLGLCVWIPKPIRSPTTTVHGSGVIQLPSAAPRATNEPSLKLTKMWIVLLMKKEEKVLFLI